MVYMSEDGLELSEDGLELSEGGLDLTHCIKKGGQVTSLLIVCFSQQSGLSVNGLSPGPGNFAFRPPADSPLIRDSTSGYGYMVTAPCSGKHPESIDDPYTL